MSRNSKITIEFRPQDKTTHVPPGITIFNAANWIGLPIDSTCGGQGTCGKCKVKVLAGSGDITLADRKVFSNNELNEGWRLSCRAEAHSDTICEVPRLMGNPKAALMGMGRHVILDPNVHKIYLQLTAPSLEDQQSDFARVQAALDSEGFQVTGGLATLRQLPTALRQADWDITAVIVGNELVCIEAGDTTHRNYGLAFDIGTTTVVGMLMNLNNGTTAAIGSALNQQASHGADVITRISYSTMEEDGLRELQAKIITTLNNIIAQLLAEAGINSIDVYETVIAGNATMLHLLLGISPEAMGVTPFIPVADSMVTAHAYELNIDMHPQGQVHLFPHIGAYVGGDLVGGLLATGLAQEDRIRLLVDVGTNGEIILGSLARTIATAAPAGPAFEGAQIQCGMRASEGAIEAVTITSTAVLLKTIGDEPPLGICGSGLLDIVAQMRLVGLLDVSGRFLSDEQAQQVLSTSLAKRLSTDEHGVRVFVLATAEESGDNQPVVITQRDIRELQFAKGAIASGIDVVMRELGIVADDLAEIFLAGSFGSYINPQSARIIGLVPSIPVERIKAVGNAAGEGAKMALLSFRQREVARSIPEIVEYHELSGRADFNDSFISVLQFPELGELGLEAITMYEV